jgi:hypothetical protein
MISTIVIINVTSIRRFSLIMKRWITHSFIRLVFRIFFLLEEEARFGAFAATFPADLVASGVATSCSVLVVCEGVAVDAFLEPFLGIEYEMEVLDANEKNSSGCEWKILGV